jgi:alpha-tubulin suppressor-like RCC1 family protein
MKAKESLNTEKLFCKIAANSGPAASAIDSKGRLWAWGSNFRFQLGNRNSDATCCISSPVKTLGSRNKFYEISCGEKRVIALDQNGSAWTWGRSNGYPYEFSTPLGYGGIDDKSTPVKIYGNKTFCKVAVGVNHSAAIDKNGKLWAWGHNGDGQIGDNSQTSRLTPVAVYGNKTFCKISFGYNSSLAIDKNGKAWQWGYVDNDAFGDINVTPVSVYGNKTFCQISKAGYRSLAIDKNGKIWRWGMGDYTYQKDYFEIIGYSATPVSISSNQTFCKIADGQTASAAIDKNGQIWTWGSNVYYGKLGNGGDPGNASTPMSIKGQKKTFCEISSTDSTFAAIDKNGRIWGWGTNLYGQLGDKKFNSSSTPRKIFGERAYNVISANGDISAGIDASGKLYLWGANSRALEEEGECLLANGKRNGFETSPIQIFGQPKTFSHISLGYYGSFAIDKNGKAWGWGSQNSGLLGNGVDSFNAPICSPVAVCGNKTFCRIAAGSVFDCAAIDKNGKIWAWGWGPANNYPDPRPTSPVLLNGQLNKTFCQISSGAVHYIALDKNGKIWSWGDNQTGALGDNTVICKSTPVLIAGATKTFCKITGSIYRSFAIDKNNQLWAWGSNSSSQGYLGINISSNATIRTPTKVYGDIKFNEISALKNYSYIPVAAYALDQNGSIWAIDKTPIKINSQTRFCKISVGGESSNYHVILTDENNIGWSFGNPRYGALGNYNSFTPVRLYNI